MALTSPRRRHPHLASGDALCISVVALTELLAGMRSGEEELTEKLLSLFTVIDIDNAVGRKAGEYSRQYNRSHKIDLGDALIAATAAIMDAKPVTRNIKHYPMTDIQIAASYERGRK